jgi:hypothetical protein
MATCVLSCQPHTDRGSPYDAYWIVIKELCDGTITSSYLNYSNSLSDEKKKSDKSDKSDNGICLTICDQNKKSTPLYVVNMNGTFVLFFFVQSPRNQHMYCVRDDTLIFTIFKRIQLDVPHCDIKLLQDYLVTDVIGIIVQYCASPVEHLLDNFLATTKSRVMDYVPRTAAQVFNHFMFNCHSNFKEFVWPRDVGLGMSISCGQTLLDNGTWYEIFYLYSPTYEILCQYDPRIEDYYKFLQGAFFSPAEAQSEISERYSGSWIATKLYAASDRQFIKNSTHETANNDCIKLCMTILANKNLPEQLSTTLKLKSDQETKPIDNQCMHILSQIDSKCVDAVTFFEYIYRLKKMKLVECYHNQKSNLMIPNY